MEKLIHLKIADRLIIINNIAFVEQLNLPESVIHFVGGESLRVSMNWKNLFELIEKELEKQ